MANAPHAGGDGHRGDGVHYQANYHISRAAVHLRSGYRDGGRDVTVLREGNVAAHPASMRRSSRRRFPERNDAPLIGSVTHNGDFSRSVIAMRHPETSPVDRRRRIFDVIR
jgi:hypothetical protein